MSSTPLRVLRSTVFARVLRASAIFILLALALLWIVVSVLRAEIDREEWTALAEERAYLENLLEEEGLGALVAELERDLPGIWEDDELYVRLEEHLFLYALRDGEHEILAGFGGLWPGEEDGLTPLDHPDIDVPVRALTFGIPLGDDFGYGTVARFEPEGRSEILAFAWFGSFALFLVGLPLSIFTGYFLSRDVFRRIEAISVTAGAVTGGDLKRRAPETGEGDEFDRLARAINDMLAALQQLNANIEAVSVGVAHDLKTPLANIRGRLELMERDDADPEARAGHIEAAQGYLSELLRIFDALLRLGEVEGGRRKAAFAPLDLSALVEDMGAAYAPVFEDARKSLAVTVAPGLSLSGDRELLEQMLANLLENALEHSRDAARARISLEQVNQGARLTIADDGPGIPPAHRTRVFERFYRADSSRTEPGSGLGLSLVKAIADLHGARVTLDDNAQGTVFHLDFPG